MPCMWVFLPAKWIQMKDCMKNQTPSQLMSTPDVTPDVPREGGKSSGTSSRACGAKTAAHLAANLAGDTDLAGNLSRHQVKIVPWFRAFRPYFLSFQSPFSKATAYYQSRNLVRKLSSYGRWFWLAFTPSCQPHHDDVNHIIMSTTHHQVVGKCNSSGVCEFTGEYTIVCETLCFLR